MKQVEKQKVEALQNAVKDLAYALVHDDRKDDEELSKEDVITLMDPIDGAVSIGDAVGWFVDALQERLDEAITDEAFGEGDAEDEEDEEEPEEEERSSPAEVVEMWRRVGRLRGVLTNFVSEEADEALRTAGLEELRSEVRELLAATACKPPVELKE